MIEEKIYTWFHFEGGYYERNAIDDEINAIIPGLYRAMDLCAVAEHETEVALGLRQSDDFQGVPRIVIARVVDE